MNAPKSFPATAGAAVLLCLLLAAGANTRESRTTAGSKDRILPQRALVIDGSPVHDVGNLHLHTGNWGAFGSQPGYTAPYSSAPSAEWPAGSGVEYLYVAGLWVGALKGGVPAVSTSAYQMEFRPTADPIDVIYYAAEGDAGGERLPNAGADDDGDGMIDEEWLDGRDQDGDGMIDEDFAAISDQMQSCWYTDDQPAAIAVYPQHNPLNLLVRQRSYQWGDPRFDDFVGFDYTIINTGNDLLEDVYVGIFVDGGVGSRSTPYYWEDDASSWRYFPYECTAWGAASVEFGYVYDADGDAGMTTGYCGVVMLDHPTDPTGQTAPPAVRFSTYIPFSCCQSYEDGGDPINDFERYEMMSSETIRSGLSGPTDVRFLVVAGPFASLAPGESLDFSVALFAGDASGGSMAEVVHNAAVAKLTYEGAWYDLDGDPATGVAGRETPVFGPATDVVVDACASPPIVVPTVPAGEVVWVNADCEREREIRIGCGYAPGDSAWYRTGIFGREGQVHWVLPTDNPVPVLVTRFDARMDQSKAVLSWDVFADEPLRGFRILRSTGGASPVALPSTTGLLPSDSRSFVDRDVTPGTSYHYTLLAVLADGTEQRSRVVVATVPAAEAALYQNQPNPFNPATTISFTLADKGAVNLSIFTPEGKLVATLVDDMLPAGFKEVPWDGRDAAGNPVASGIYVYRLKTGKTVLTRKMVHIK